MANIQKASKISTDVESDFNISINYATETNDGDSSNIEYLNLKPSDRQNYDIGHCGPGSNRGTDSNLRQIIEIPSFQFQTSGIHKDLLINLSKLKYTTPTKIQKYTLPIIMGGKDLIASTQTGSGKTVAFVIPILNCLLNNLPIINGKVQRCDPLAVIVVPTKQDVKHTYNVIGKLSKDTSIESVALYNIASVPGQKRKIMCGVHIIVTTPDSLVSFVTRGWITFTALRIVVFDKADLIIEMGYKPELEFILNHKTMVSTHKRSTVLFSTTMTNDVKQLAMTYLKSNYVTVNVEEIREVCTDIITQTI